jgi:hypothetical protein
MRSWFPVAVIAALAIGSACSDNSGPTLTPPVLTVHGKVVSTASNKPVADALVKAEAAQDTASATTDADGNFLLTVKSDACHGVLVFVSRQGYSQRSTSPDEINACNAVYFMIPLPIKTHIYPQPVTLPLAGTVLFQAAVTVFDGTVFNPAAGIGWSVASAVQNDPACGSFVPVATLGQNTAELYVAPATLPSLGECGGTLAGEVRVVADPGSADVPFSVADTALVTLTP